MIKRGIAHIGVFFLRLISLLPLVVLFFFARLLYYLIYYVVGYRKKIVRRNLTHSFPEKSTAEIIAIEKKFYLYLSELMFEIIKMCSISEKELLKRVKFTGLEQLEAHFEKGESILACSGHYGNWEWGSMAINLKISAQVMTIYKPLNNKIFDDFFSRFRSRFGSVLIPMRQTLRGISAYKNQITLLGFASDQSPVQHEARHFIDFLNQPTAALLGIEKIAKATNRPIYYFKLNVVKKGYYVVDISPLCLNPTATEEFEITKLHFKFLEEIIKKKPQYWLWSHNRWKIKPQ